MKMAERQRTMRQVTSFRGPLLAGLATCAVFLGGFAAWAFGIPLSGAIIAQGTVIKDGNVQVVRHERGGVLTFLKVREGAEVRSGDVLATLTRADDQASAEELKARIASLTAKQARLSAEQRQEDSFTVALDELPETARDLPEGLLSQLVSDQEQEFATRRKQRSDLSNVLNAQRRGLAEQIAGAEGELAALARQKASLLQDIELRRKGVANGYGRENILRELERQADGLAGSIARTEASILALKQQMIETDNRMAAEQSGFMEKTGDELARIRAERLVAVEAMAGRAEAVARIDVRSPVDGVVNKLHVNTIGSAVEPFAPIFEIVADDQPLLIEAKVNPADINSVYRGQAAHAVISAFNRRLYDPVQAEVTFVGADARQDQPDQPFHYTIRLVVDDAELARLPEVMPGMPSEVYLLTHDRTFADYIAEPFIESFQRSFRQ